MFAALPLVYACIAPHGDEMVQELVGDKPGFAVETANGMTKLAAEMEKSRPDTIVIATPHNLRLLGRIGVVTAENSSGRVGVGDKSIALEAKCDTEIAMELVSAAEEARIPVAGANYGTASGPLSNMAMDWGTLIPLWFFLRLTRLRSRIVIVTPSREIPLKQNYIFGVKVAQVAERSGKRVAFVASSEAIIAASCLWMAVVHLSTAKTPLFPSAMLADRNLTIGLIFSALMGLVLPMCECASVVVIRRLIRKGLPLSCAITYMMGAPIVSPVVALSQSGMVVSRRGSITEISGTRVRLMMVILLRAAVSVTIANCDTSAPVPEVDGAITVGGIGRTTLSTPS